MPADLTIVLRILPQKNFRTKLEMTAPIYIYSILVQIAFPVPIVQKKIPIGKMQVRCCTNFDHYCRLLFLLKRCEKSLGRTEVLTALSNPLFCRCLQRTFGEKLSIGEFVSFLLARH